MYTGTHAQQKSGMHNATSVTTHLCVLDQSHLNLHRQMSKKQQTLSSFFGVLPPTKKHQLEPELKKILFSEKWLQDVQWLEVNDERTEMRCKIWRSHPHLADKTGAFYKGSKNFYHRNKHENSKEHTNVAEAIAKKQASQEEMSSCPLTRWQTS